MKKSNILLLALAIGLTIMLSTVFLQSSNDKQASKQGDKSEQVEQNKLVKHITAKYMREHIYDYKENPTKFVFKGERPAVLDFYAKWCGPCRQLSPKISKLAEKYKGQIDFYKVNVDNEEALARLFGVRSIPMLLFIPMKGAPIQTVGGLSMEQLEENLAKIKTK